MKTIDTYYLLDEIEILGRLVEQLANHSGLTAMLQANGLLPTVAPQVLTRRTLSHTAGLFEELAKRRAWRTRTGTLMQKPRVDSRSVFQRVEGYLQTLSKVPGESEMRVIVAAKAIQDRADVMEITKHLQYKAVSGSAAVAALDHLRTLSDSGSEEFEKYIASLGPDLPEPLRKNWHEAVREIAVDIENMSGIDLVNQYQKYLDWVLDRYAMDPAFMGGFNRKEQLPEGYEPRYTLISQPHYPENDIYHGWKYTDSFWNRSAQITATRNPEEPWVAKIIFEPLALDRVISEVLLIPVEGLNHIEIISICVAHDVPKGIVNEMISENFSAKWLANRTQMDAGSSTGHEEWGLFDTRLQAMIWVCNIPQLKEEPSPDSRRELTEEDRKELERLADEPAIEAMPQSFLRDIATLSFRAHLRQEERDELFKHIEEGPVLIREADELEVPDGSMPPGVPPVLGVDARIGVSERFAQAYVGNTDPTDRTDLINQILDSISKLSTEQLLEAREHITMMAKR